MSAGASGDEPPRVTAEPPAARSRRLADRLSRTESRNVTHLTEDFPVFWERSRGSNVWDVDGNRYVDLTAGFGVAGVGHGHPRVVEAVRRQAEALLHGMGDVHPPAVKVDLLERLTSLAPMSGSRAVLGTSGAEAVEVALKTARLHTGKPGVIAFTGAYHGLTYGALAVTDRDFFRRPFEDQLNPHVFRAPFPHPYRPPVGLGGGTELTEAALEAAEDVLSRDHSRVGAVIVEPVQGRGGQVVPPRGFLAALADLCNRANLLLIADEVYTGFGRTGRRFACEHEGVVPDLLCVGKALSGSLPVSACIGREDVMEAWPPSGGEAIHTSTFMGNPTACAAALAALEVTREERLAERARREGERWLRRLEGMGRDHAAVGDVRGRGLTVGLDLVRDRESREPAPDLARRFVREALRRGWIVLAGGPSGNVLSLSPPLTIGRELLDEFVEVADRILGGG